MLLFANLRTSCRGCQFQFLSPLITKKICMKNTTYVIIIIYANCSQSISIILNFFVSSPLASISISCRLAMLISQNAKELLSQLFFPFPLSDLAKSYIHYLCIGRHYISQNHIFLQLSASLIFYPLLHQFRIAYSSSEKWKLYTWTSITLT